MMSGGGLRAPAAEPLEMTMYKEARIPLKYVIPSLGVGLLAGSALSLPADRFAVRHLNGRAKEIAQKRLQIATERNMRALQKSSSIATPILDGIRKQARISSVMKRFGTALGRNPKLVRGRFLSTPYMKKFFRSTSIFPGGAGQYIQPSRWRNVATRALTSG